MNRAKRIAKEALEIFKKRYVFNTLDETDIDEDVLALYEGIYSIGFKDGQKEALDIISSIERKDRTNDK